MPGDSTKPKPVHPSKIPVDYVADVLGHYTPGTPLPDYLKKLTKWHLKDWWWFCNWCLCKRTWGDFPIGPSGWPLEPCRECEARIKAQGGKRPGKRLKEMAWRKIARQGFSISKPTAVESLCAVFLNQVGGVQGYAKFVARTLRSEWMWPSVRLRMLQNLTMAMREAERIQLERVRLEDSRELTYKKSLRTMSDEQLREVLRPLLFEMLKKRPEVGIQALKSAGYVVGKHGHELACQIQKLPPRHRQKILQALAGAESPPAPPPDDWPPTPDPDAATSSGPAHHAACDAATAPADQTSPLASHSGCDHADLPQ